MRLSQNFYTSEAETVAQQLIGCSIIRTFSNNESVRFLITETEAYLGTQDKACHASKGRTPRTEVMFCQGGVIYMYLIYGIHWMFNVVTGPKESPQAVLIRGIHGAIGPGRVTRLLQMDKSYNGVSLIDSANIWIEPATQKFKFISTARVGIDYAGPYWSKRKLRFIIK